MMTGNTSRVAVRGVGEGSDFVARDNKGEVLHQFDNPVFMLDLFYDRPLAILS